MRILLAPTAYKGSLSPAQVSIAIGEGIKKYAQSAAKHIDVELLPLADGGDGTIEALALSIGGSIERIAVLGACNEQRDAVWLKTNKLAVVELASACGIAGLTRDQLSPMKAHSCGLGTVIARVLEETTEEEIIIALGGSASTDGGSGALYELGARFYDAQGKSIIPHGGGMLNQIQSCEFSALTQKVGARSIKIATDVSSPLTGSQGAASIFGPQKGANSEEVKTLDANLSHFADVLESSLHASARNIPGAGAAGGCGFGLALGLQAEIISGFDWMSKKLGLEQRIEQSDLVISGEGRIDASSLQGKVIGSLINTCKKHKKPLWLIAGSINVEPSDNIDVDLLAAASDGSRFATEEDLAEYVFHALESSNIAKR